MSKRPLFEHRHFAWLADFMANKHMYNGLEINQIENLADELAKTNPGFDRDRFIDAANGFPQNRDKIR